MSVISTTSGAVKKVSLARKPSPPRGDTAAEKTFQQKLDEIKRIRSEAGPVIVPGVPPDRGGGGEARQMMTVTGVKTFLKSFNDWVEVVSKSGKIYYYNKRTLVNQWKKPDDWLKEEERLNPPLPPPEVPEQPPAPPADPPPPLEDAKLKIKIKGKKKVKKRLKNPDSNLPIAYQKNGKRMEESSSDEEDVKKPKLTIENAFEDPESVSQDQELILAKLDPKDEIGHLKPEAVSASLDTTVNGSEGKNEEELGDINSSSQPPVPDEAKSRDIKDGRKFDPRISGPERAENLVVGCAAALAFKNISVLPEATALYGENSLPPPPNMLGNPTFFSEYNLPCCLRRCKFPKEQDVLHELKINKLKRRTFQPPALTAGLDPNLAHLAREAELEQFFLEIKNYNNHDRLLTNRMNEVLVYKVPDDVWERYFHLFQIKIFDGVFLECKPSGYTHNDELIYSRTGKICGHKTFPEDEARCQAVLQAWDKDHCLCMYANRVFKIRRDDELWKDDLYETKRFLEKRGF